MKATFIRIFLVINVLVSNSIASTFLAQNNLNKSEQSSKENLSKKKVAELLSKVEIKFSPIFKMHGYIWLPQIIS